MDTRYGGVVFALKEGNRVEIKFAAWLCRSFHQIFATQTIGVQQTFRNMNGSAQQS
jgi:hypothetical protein